MYNTDNKIVIIPYLQSAHMMIGIIFKLFDAAEVFARLFIFHKALNQIKPNHLVHIFPIVKQLINTKNKLVLWNWAFSIEYHSAIIEHIHRF